MTDSRSTVPACETLRVVKMCCLPCAEKELGRLTDEIERLQEAIAEAMTSLATGPVRGYAFAALERALESSVPKETVGGNG